MPHTAGFWSYVRADDDAEGGRITQLGRDVAAEFEMQTSETIELFLDRDDIAWGDQWRERIDSSLADVAFFIAVITPRYFQRPECRRELQTFARQATALGVADLLLPILYVDVPSLRDDDHTDELVALIKTFQHENWTSKRFLDRTSGEYRQGVSGLASRLASANRRADQAAANGDPLPIAAQLDVDDEPGIIDRIALAEAALPEWTQTVGRISEAFGEFGQLMVGATEEMSTADAAGKGFVGRVVVARRVARELAPIAGQIVQLGQQYTRQMYEVDTGTRALIESAPTQIDTDDDRDVVCGFFHSVSELSRQAREAFDGVETLVGSFAPIERMSRDLRPGLRDIRQALTVMLEGRAVTDEWARLIAQSPVRCTPIATDT